MTSPDYFWVAAIVAAFLVGASKGGLPMVAILSVPIMSFVMPPMLGAALLLPVYLISDAYGIFIYRRSFSPRNLTILIPASAVGIAAGYLVADRIDDNAVRILIGVVGLSFLFVRLRSEIVGRPAPRPTDIPRGVVWGGIAGFTSFVSHAGGPAFQIYALPQQMPKMTFAGTSTILFATINLMKVPPYVALDILNWGDARVVAVLAPFALFGAWLGYRITLIIPERIFYRLVEIALLLISVNLIRVGLTSG